MTDEGGMAFADLFSQRRDEIGLSLVDIATLTERPIEVVVAWDRGRMAPDRGEVQKVAETLRLPEALLHEALRRVAEYREGTAALESGAGAAEPGDPEVEAEPTGDTATRLSGLRPVRRLRLPSPRGWFASVRKSIARKRRLARAPVSQPSYLEDRDQMVAYRLRTVFTVAGIVVLILVLRWSLGGLGSAVADLWQALTSAFS